MEEFEEEFMKYTYIKLATVIEKSGGDKWKSMTDGEQSPYVT